MIEPAIPEDELERMEAVRALQILDSDPDERFDRLTKIAKRIFDVEIALLTIVDSNRQWFKSVEGLDVSETPRSISFCGHAILGDELFLVANARKDERFVDNPLVMEQPNIRFYAGYPIKVSSGHKIGTFCLIDSSPREMTDSDKELFIDLAQMAEREVNALQVSTLDQLTNVSNRYGFLAIAEKTIKQCRANNVPLTLLIIDLDDFKLANRALGREEGDRLLFSFANFIKGSIRQSDVCARIEGDSFAVLMPDASNSDVTNLLKKLKGLQNSHNKASTHQYKLSFSCGMCHQVPEELQSIGDMLTKAEGQLHQKAS